MSDYTPTTEDIRGRASVNFVGVPVSGLAEQFDRWLERHDAEVYQRGREDAAKAVEALHFPDPHCHTEPTEEADAQDMIGCGYCWDGEYRFDKWPCDSILAARGDGEQE